MHDPFQQAPAHKGFVAITGAAKTQPKSQKLPCDTRYSRARELVKVNVKVDAAPAARAKP